MLQAWAWLVKIWKEGCNRHNSVLAVATYNGTYDILMSMTLPRTDESIDSVRSAVIKVAESNECVNENETDRGRIKEHTLWPTSDCYQSFFRDAEHLVAKYVLSCRGTVVSR